MPDCIGKVEAPKKKYLIHKKGVRSFNQAPPPSYPLWQTLYYSYRQNTKKIHRQPVPFLAFINF